MRRGTPLIAATLLILGVWIASPLLSVVHAVFEEHRYCAEHERLEEASETHVPGDSKTGATGAIASSNSGELPTEHEDCAFDEDFTRTIPDSTLVLLATPAPAILPPAQIRTIAFVHGISLLHVAPKSSPPTIA